MFVDNTKAVAVGYISIRPLHIENIQSSFQMRYFISPAYGNKRIATVAGKKVVKIFQRIFGKSNKSEKQLYCVIDPNNIPSMKTAINLGFTKYKISNEYGKIMQIMKLA